MRNLIEKSLNLTSYETDLIETLCSLESYDKIENRDNKILFSSNKVFSNLTVTKKNNIIIANAIYSENNHIIKTVYTLDINNNEYQAGHELDMGILKAIQNNKKLIILANNNKLDIVKSIENKDICNMDDPGYYLNIGKIYFLNEAIKQIKGKAL